MKEGNGRQVATGKAAALAPVVALRQELAAINTPAEALGVMDRAARTREAYRLMNHSVEECNQVAEVYLLATRKFGEMAKDIPAHRPKANIDVGLMEGTPRQRQYARKVEATAKESDILDYVREVTSEHDQASIAGLLEWLEPGRHGNLQGIYEWYTPPAIIEAARAVMGEIDLDPASCAQANEIVQATEFYSEETDGLAQIWNGRVFLNPPFAHPTVKHFADKLLESFGAGSVEQAVWLSNACVDVGWWQDLAQLGSVCFHRGRIQFYGPDGKLQPPTLGQSIIYLGDNDAAFKEAFLPFGVVMVAM
jgi:hypothetical protein